MRRLNPTLFALCVAAPALLAAQEHHPPRFEDYPVTRTYDGEPAPVDLTSASWARRFRTVLRRGAANGPNFAGELTVVEWGCGTSCQQAAIIKTRTGRIVGPLLTLTRGADYWIDSRLMVVDPVQAGDSVSGFEPPFVRYFAWTGKRMVLIDSIPARAPRQ